MAGLNRNSPCRPGRQRKLAILALLLLLSSCGGEVGGDHSGGSGGLGGVADGGGAAGAGGAAGTGGTGGTGGSGWTECSTPDYGFCGVSECPERPGCTICLPADEPGLYGTCAESLSAEEVGFKPADGKILLSDSPLKVPYVLNEATFSAGVFLAAHGQANRVAYADRGVWTGAPIPVPQTCTPVTGIEICGGVCGGCPVGQICTGRAPKHPYGLCVPIKAGICSLNAAVNGDTCESTEQCFVFEVEAEQQPMADARGFCLAKSACQAAASNLPGGGRCE